MCAITKNDKNTSCIKGNYVYGHLVPSVAYIVHGSLSSFLPLLSTFQSHSARGAKPSVLTCTCRYLGGRRRRMDQTCPSHRSPFVSSTPSVPTKEGENRAEMGVRRGRNGRSRKGPKLPPTHMVQQLLLCKGAKRKFFYFALKERYSCFPFPFSGGCLEKDAPPFRLCFFHQGWPTATARPPSLTYPPFPPLSCFAARPSIASSFIAMVMPKFSFFSSLPCPGSLSRVGVGNWSKKGDSARRALLLPKVQSVFFFKK